MSVRLTLLFLCDQTDRHSLLISALRGAGFELVIEHHPDNAKEILSCVRADAVMIRHHAIPDGSLIGAELKVIAPHTPIILFPDAQPSRGRQLGVDSLCHADPSDETLARAVAVFFHGALTSKSPQRPTRRSNETLQLAAAPGKNQLTL